MHGVSLTADPGRGGRDRRRVRQRQDPDLPRGPGHPAEPFEVVGRHRSQLFGARHRRRSTRRPGPPCAARRSAPCSRTPPPTSTPRSGSARRSQEVLRVKSRTRSARGAAPGGGAVRRRSTCATRGRLPAVPARAVRRHAAARPDRRRDRRGAAGADRRRGDDRAGRHGAGRDPRPARRRCRSGPGSRCSSSPTTWRWSPSCATRSWSCATGWSWSAAPRDEVLYHPQHEYTRLLVAEHEQFGLERFLAAGGAAMADRRLAGRAGAPLLQVLGSRSSTARGPSRRRAPTGARLSVSAPGETRRRHRRDRIGQVDAGPGRPRSGAGHGRPDRLRRARPDRRTAAGSGGPCAAAGVVQYVFQDPLRSLDPDLTRRRSRGRTAAAAADARGAAVAAPGPSTCSRVTSSRPARARCPESCPAASASGSRWPGR